MSEQGQVVRCVLCAQVMEEQAHRVSAYICNNVECPMNSLTPEAHKALSAKLGGAVVPTLSADSIVAWYLLQEESQFRHQPVAIWEQGYRHGLKTGAQAAIDCFAIQSRKAAPQPVEVAGEELRKGIEASAKLLEKKAEEYAHEFGSDDMGGLSFGGGEHAEIKLDYYNNLLELAEEIRAIGAAK